MVAGSLMRIAIVSDTHGNRTALEAVLADLKQTSPDLIFHGGDLADSGSSPVEVLDRVRDLGWPGVVGNTDEMLALPETLEEFAGQSKAAPALWDAIGDWCGDSRRVRRRKARVVESAAEDPDAGRDGAGACESGGSVEGAGAGGGRCGVGGCLWTVGGKDCRLRTRASRVCAAAFHDDRCEFGQRQSFL